jgi:hypothetical protein
MGKMLPMVSIVEGSAIEYAAVLSVHDSLIVPAYHAEQTAEIMMAAFAARFPESSQCKVRIKDRNVSTNGRNAPNRSSA